MSNPIIDKLIDRRDLSRREATSLMRSMMSGDIEEAPIAAALTALRLKGETVDEIAGFVTAMRERVVPVTPKAEGVVDTCGTGGDARQTFNISTTTAFVAAAMGIPVAKHGNRSVSSKCGSCDVLEALGVAIDFDPNTLADLIDSVGLAFMFAPAHHPAMQYVAPVRKKLGFRTVFNLLGPIVNPAGVRRQLVGVYDPGLTEVVAKVLRALGSERVFVVHGRDGADEVSITGETIVSFLDGGHIHTMTFTPEDAGIERASLEDIRGGSFDENARHVNDVLTGKPGPRRDVVVLNAAFVAVVASRVRHLDQGVEAAREAIDSGRALAVLNRLREASAVLKLSTHNE